MNKAPTKKLFVLALAAEMLASLWRLLTLPTDTYIGVGNYELGRMLYWLPLIGLALVFVSIFEAKFQTLQSNEKTRRLFLHFVAVAALAFCVEALTSLGYWWRSPHSGPVRALYEKSGIGSEFLVQVTMDGAVLPVILWTILDRGLPS